MARSFSRRAASADAGEEGAGLVEALAAVRQPLPGASRLQKIFFLAGPVLVEQLLFALAAFIDLYVAGKLGAEEVAAVGLVQALLAVCVAVFTALGTGAAALISRQAGAGQRELAQQTAGQSILAACGAAVLFALLGFALAEETLSLLGVANAALPVGRAYLQILSLSLVFLALMTALGQLLRCAGDAATPFYIGVVVQVLRLLFLYGLVFIGSWGVAGLAWATVAAQLVGAMLLVLALRRSWLGGWCVQEALQSSWRLFWNCSAPLVAERLVMRLGQLLYAGMIVYVGADIYAAFVLAGSISSFSFLAGYALAAAAVILVGYEFGSARFGEARRFVWLLCRLGIGIMGLLGLAFFVFASWIGPLASADKVVADLVCWSLQLDAFAQPFIAVSLILAGALQGSGDCRSSLFSTIAGIWLIRIPGIFFLCLWGHGGITGVWLVNGLDYVLRAIFLTKRFQIHLKQAVHEV
ncbi:MATE family efflux transporter [uncultured Anaeromusa sp.]|uniref:MATE family efflux transporter n=1 Tax=uncultured Anaeromusa sp. TaxID=673273 RepID=UPI0029C78D04|nr:MATE family efflux transporter [uncultured Anaeromusa sp.]